MIARGIFLGCDFVVHIYIARVLGPEAYGIYGVILALLAIVSQPLNVGLNQSVSKYVAEDHSRARGILREGLKMQVILAVALMAIFAGFSGPASTILKSDTIGEYMIIASFILPGLGILTILLGLLNGMRSFNREALALSSWPLMRTLAALILIYLGYGVAGAIWSFFIGIVFSVALAFVLFNPPAERTDFQGSRLRTFAVPVFILGMAMIVVPNIDLLFVKGILVDEKETGIYNSARVIARSSYFFFLAMGSTIFPSISESVSVKDAERTTSYIKQGVRYLMMMSLPVACLVSAYGTEIISIVFSRTYSSSGSALSVLMFGFTFLTLFSVLTTMLMAGGQTRGAVVAGLLLLPIDAVLNLMMIPRYGLVGAALATSLTAIIGVAVASWLVLREFGTCWEMGPLLKIMTASGAIYCAAVFVSPPVSWLVPWIVFLSVLYCLILFLMGELDGRDWVTLRDIVFRSSGRSDLEEAGS